jgi:RND superfamily putative drug exporter
MDEPATGTRVPRWLRAVIPTVLILVWITAGAIGGPYFGRIDEVSSNDQTSYLPADAESTVVQKLQREFTDSNAIPAIVVYVRSAGLSEADRQFADERIAAIEDVSGIGDEVSPAIPSQDGKAIEIFVPVDDTTEATETVGALRDLASRYLPTGLSAYVTGPAGQIADLAGAFAGIDGVLLLVAILAVLVILIIVYRSPLLPLLVLGTSMFALCASIVTVWWLAKDGIVTINGQVQGILFILVIGAATDYSLLYVSRYREALRGNPRRWDATWAAIKASIEPIAASAGTVIAGLLCLLLSELNSNKALGPVASIGIVFAFLASMTFLPALLQATGRAAFWPVSPHLETEQGHRQSDAVPGFWSRLASRIALAPRLTWITCVILLLAACTGLLQLKASGIPQSDLVLGQSQARDGQSVLGEHFPGGSGSPTVIVTDEATLLGTTRTVLDNDGVELLVVVSADSPSGTLPVTADGIQSFGPPTAQPLKPTVVGGRVLLQATLDTAPDSASAEKTVRSLRAQLDGTNHTLVGGVTATAIDTDDAAVHDRNLIIPVVLVVILLILMLLLRSIVAPVLLVLTVVLSFAATMGISALVFNHLFQFPGADPAVPLYGFIFLVALGVDYNIFLMTRVREESLLSGTRVGVQRGLAITGGVITSAGIVLAATFAALAVIPVLFLAQIAFIVGFGVLLDALIVRSLVVPAISYDLGRWVWWPSKLARTEDSRKVRPRSGFGAS